MINQETITYVISAPYFWLSMGMTTAVSVFIGAIIYDGEISNAYKGLISVILYAFFIFQVDLTRIQDFFTRHPSNLDLTRYAGVLSILITTFFWVVGIFFGVLTSRYVIHRKRV